MNPTLTQEPVTMMPVTAPLQYEGSVVTRLEAFNAMADEWNTLLKAAGVENGCLRHEWLSTWLQHFPAELLIILVRDAVSGKLVAAAPLTIQKGINGLCRKLLRHGQFVGTELSVYDWMAIPVARSADEPLALKMIAEMLLAHQDRWDVLELHYLLETRQLEILRDRLAKKAHRGELSETSRMPYLTLPETAEAYARAKKTPRLKKSVNAGRNRLKTEGKELALEIRTPSNETNAILDRFFEQHTAYWTSRGRVSNFIRFPQLSRFYKDVFQKSQAFAGTDAPHLTFSLLKSGNTHLSYQFGFWQGGSYLDYINSYSEEGKAYSPGILHKEELIRHIIGCGYHVYNFGRGLEKYKELWTRDSQPLWSLVVYKNMLAYQLCQTDHRLKKLLRKPTADSL